jgi:hypothetical protein
MKKTKNLIMRTLRIYFLLATIVLFAGCSKDEPQLPASELILGQWKWYSQGLKQINTEGETLEIYNQYYPPGAFVKFQSPDLVEASQDGINIDQGTWKLSEADQNLYIIDTNFKILRLDKEYLIIGYDTTDPLIQQTTRFTFIFKR